MGNGLGFIIIGTILFVASAALMAFYSYKLSKQFPKLVRAKVTRIETLENGRFKYHFEGKSNGRRIMADTVTYKEKKWKVGEKINVRMSVKGNECHSDFPIWPTISAIICLMMALIVPIAFFAESAELEHDHDHEGETSTELYQENGYYVITDDEAYLYGDNIGLVQLSYAEDHISTGDYGYVYFIGEPESDGSNAPMITSLGASVSTDGTPDDLPDGVIEQVEALGGKVNLDVTDSATIIEENATEEATEPSQDIEDGETTPLGAEGHESAENEDTHNDGDSETVNNNESDDESTELTTSSTEPSADNTNQD